MSKLKKFIVDKNGQWAHPGKPTMIPNANGRITMQGVPYPVYGVDDQGNAIMMMPGGEYQFPGNHVYETPMVKMGGDPSIPDLSNKSWLSKYQSGGIIKIGTKLEARQAGNTYEVRRPNANSWITLNDDQLATFKEMFSDDLQDNIPVWSPEEVIKRASQTKPKKATQQSGPVNPAIATIAPTIYSASTGVDLPKTKEIKEDIKIDNYKKSPYFHVTPYDTPDTAIKEYEKTPDYNLRHKADNKYTADEIKSIQNHLVNTGYISAQEKLDPANYKTKEDVLSLQKYLISQGMADKFLNKDVRNLSGTMDKQTIAAIDQYNKNRLPFKEGELDDTTKMAIDKYKEDADATNTLNVKIIDPESSDVSSERILKDFQNNLAARGYFTGDYDFKLEPKPLGEAKVAYNFRVSDNPDTPFEYCAQYLSGNVGKEDIVGMQEREKLGLYGDAWGMPDNIVKKGGKVIFKGLPERKLTDYKSKQDIESGVKTALMDSDLMSDLRSIIGSGNVLDKNNLPQIRPGDVVNMFYEGSPSAEIAYNQTGPNNSSFYTTHIGIVKADDAGNLYVEHNVHKKIQKDPIQKFLNGEVKGNGGKGVTLISGITRPNYFTDVDWNGTISPSGVSYYQTEAGKVNPKGALANPGDWGMQTIAGEETHKFMSTIENNKDLLLKDIPISEREYNQLMRAARVLPTTETTAGKNLKGWHLNAEDIGKEIIDATGLSERSRGFTNIKDKQNFNPDLREKLIQDDSDLNDPVKAAIPTFYALSNRYLYLKEFANRNNIKVTPEELSKLSLMAYTHKIENVANDLRATGSFRGYVQKQEEAAKERGNETFQGKNMLEIFDKQTMKKGGSVKWLQKYQKAGQVMTYASNPEYFDNHAIYHDNPKVNDLIRSKVYAGTHGWDPVNKALVKLDKPVYVPPAIQEQSTEDWGKKTYQQRFESNTPAGKEVRKAAVKNSMQEMVKNPSFYAPGVAAASIFTGPAAASALGTALEAPMVIGSTTIPGVTVGSTLNALGAGISTQQLLDPTSTVRQSLNVAYENPNTENVLNAVGELGLTGLGYVGLGIGKGAVKGTKRAGKYLTTQTPLNLTTPTRDLEELRRAYHNAERFLTMDESAYLHKHGHGIRDNYLLPENAQRLYGNELPPPPSEIYFTPSGEARVRYNQIPVNINQQPGTIDLTRRNPIIPPTPGRVLRNAEEASQAWDEWVAANQINTDYLPDDMVTRAENVLKRYGLQGVTNADIEDRLMNLSPEQKQGFYTEFYHNLNNIFTPSEIHAMRRPSVTTNPFTVTPRNQSGLTKEEILARLDSKNKDKVSKLTEDEFKNTVLKPNGEVVEHKPGTEIDKMTYDTSGRRMVLKDQRPLSEEEYAQAFNENLDLLNQMIAERNRTGIQYRVKGLDKNGRLRFETPAGQTYTNDAGELISVPEGETSWAVNINPGQWRGNVEDIANTEYFRSIPGLEMSNTTQGVFADNIPRRGTGTYDVLNDYLKRLDLGRIKPGFNSQTAYSKGAWENFIKSGKAFGFYGGPNVVYGTMRTVAPYAIPTIIGAGAAASQQKHGGWISKYQVGGPQDMPFDLPLKNQNPYLIPEYYQPRNNKGEILPDPQRPKIGFGINASEFKASLDSGSKDEVQVPLISSGQWLGDNFYERYNITGDRFKTMTDPSSYSQFYDMIDQLGLMKQKKGGSTAKNQYINNVPLKPTSWLNKYQ
jgi:hypothetical protein